MGHFFGQKWQLKTIFIHNTDLPQAENGEGGHPPPLGMQSADKLDWHALNAWCLPAGFARLITETSFHNSPGLEGWKQTTGQTREPTMLATCTCLYLSQYLVTRVKISGLLQGPPQPLPFGQMRPPDCPCKGQDHDHLVNHFVPTGHTWAALEPFLSNMHIKEVNVYSGDVEGQGHNGGQITD